ncbi:MAG: YdcF family protein [Thiolinea sp.]
MDNALLNRTLEFLLFPPGNLLWLLLLALLWRKRPVLLNTLLLCGLLMVLVFSLPVVSNALLGSLENQYPPQYQRWEQDSRPQAIVVLGAGRNRQVPEYGGETTSLIGTERLRYAALLHRETGLPILVSGGQPLPDVRSEAELMRDTLEQEFRVPVRWLEDQSHTTWQNAEFTDQMLAAAGIRSAWLVTQAWHMPRSLLVFSHRQVSYQPASVSFSAATPWSERYMKWVPQAAALSRSLIALHEWLGLGWYRLRLYLK